MKASKNIKTLPFLKNGSRAEEFKNGTIILSNTCAFDAVVSLIILVFCDSTNFSHKIYRILSKILKNGILSNSYIERAELIADGLNPKLEFLQNDITILICNTTAVEVIQVMLADFPSVIEIINCSNEDC
ncbi:Uncharacterized protein FWK35_00027914 [Aphis craccivora]|uniref:Uncharacterized protein n=1 Tax=Aphis craccivora TaxID=307492 RepID=A0A6G0VTI6_APHCR|nr:Uncharacterized protein FWK35_00027914 [Aphis craccivora]